ncbi:hypothetical protein SKAU_G00404070 [Synaphobranchus kaupii]|uniref:Uncharacterized protein n=1 Tax=Synaphobranchus kaupii TaxID=118154 RepID=A0A9Q1IAN1_SYNKA|nr:hypothetical protein SKAU_G00404070 [Synaphobranchus kaupii]
MRGGKSFGPRPTGAAVFSGKHLFLGKKTWPGCSISMQTFEKDGKGKIQWDRERGGEEGESLEELASPDLNVQTRRSPNAELKNAPHITQALDLSGKCPEHGRARLVRGPTFLGLATSASLLSLICLCFLVPPSGVSAGGVQCDWGGAGYPLEQRHRAGMAPPGDGEGQRKVLGELLPAAGL